MNTKKIITLLISIMLVMGMMNVCSFAETGIILSPQNGDVLYASPESFAFSSDGHEKLVAYLDGEFFGEGAGSVMNVDETLSLGEHTLKAVKILSDGTAKSEEITFTIKQNSVNGVGEWREEVITFDTMSDDYDTVRVMNSDIANEILDEFGWNLVYTHPSGSDPVTRKISRVDGKNHSTNENDYALLIDYTDATETVWGAQAGMIFQGSEKTRESMQNAGGELLVEFDIMTFDASPTIFLYLPFAMWGETSYNGQYFLANGSTKLRDTNVDVTPNVWHNFKLHYDITNDKWNVWLDGVKVVENVKARSEFHNNDLTGVYIIPKKDRNNGIALDNFKMSHSKIYNVINKVQFVSEKGVGEDRFNVSPDTTEINISLSDRFSSISADDVILRTTEGRKIQSEISYDAENAVLSILPKKVITPLCDMEIVLKEGIEYADGTTLSDDFVYKIRSGSSIKQSVTYTADGKEILSKKQLEGKSALSLSVNAALEEGAEKFEGVYVMTILKDEKIVAMTAEDVSLSSEKTSDTITLQASLPEGAENCEVRLMLCDSLTGCVAQGKYISLK